MYRNTYLEINLNSIKHNTQMLIKRYNQYKYYIGVVKADSYGHNDIKVVKTIIDAGCNYLAVATLDEALEIRSHLKDIPILCLGTIPYNHINLCLENNITVTINNLDYLQKLRPYDNLKVHIKINTGMNRLGVNNSEELEKMYALIKEKGYILEGIYTHMFNPTDKETTLKQFENFELITKNIPIKDIPIIHLGASVATEKFPKKAYANGCRLGIAMYGLVDYPNMKFLPTYRLISEVIQINEVTDGTVGYDGAYKVRATETIAVVSIGYADGIIRKNTGRYVYINDKRYKIVGNICMDMLFVKVGNEVKVGDKVILIKDIEHIKEIAEYLDTIGPEVICSIGKRVPRVYIE